MATSSDTELAKPGIAMWMFNYAPQWEAASKEVRLLATEFAAFGTQVVGLNLNGQRLQLRGRERVYPLPYALAGLPLLPWLLGRARINHLFASAAERLLLPRLRGERALLTITKDTPSLTALERNLPHLRRLRYVVVESPRDRELLRQGGVDEDRIKLIYPGASVRPYRPASGPLRILFATSPLGGHGLLSRGVYLLVRVARLLPDVQFLLIWRERHYAALKTLLEDARVGNVEVRNGYVADMGAVYDSVHAAVLPGLDATSLKPCPHSALESLAHGKPLLMSRPTSIAPLIAERRCGVVFEPETEALRAAIHELRERYDEYQTNCHSTVEQCFSARVFLERYRRLYEAML